MAKYWQGAFWTQEFLTSCSWNPQTVTRITNSEHKSYPIQSQKRILRPTGSSTWGEFWERSPCISLTFTLWLMTIPIKGQAGFRVWAASSACRTLSGSMDTFFLLQDLSFCTFLNPCIRGHEELFSTWLQPVWCVRVSLLHLETRGHILTQSNSFIACKNITSGFLYSFYPFTCGSQEWLLLSGLLGQMVFLQSCGSAGRTMVSQSCLQDRQAAGRSRGSCLRMQISAGLGLSSAWLCEMYLQNVLFKTFWKENTPEHFYSTEKTKVKENKRKREK